MQRIYEQYGELTRTGPNEITICRPDALELLDGPKNNNTRDVWYDILHPRRALVFSRQPDEIRALRQSWSKAVSSKCTLTGLKEYSPRIVKLSDDLVNCITSYNGEPVKMNDVMSWFSFDAMGEMTFGEDFGMMRDKKIKKQLAHQREALALLEPFNDATWLAHAGFSLFPFLPVAKNCASYRRNVLMGNSISAMVAGSDTTRAALIGIWYYMCHHPEHMEKIYNEVHGINVDDVSRLVLLPHLDAVLKEALRLAPPATTGGSRIVGPARLQVNDQFIPGGTKISAPKYVIHRRKCSVS
ncbi:cytochrome P450 [Byssothecium circinans]|uniref:Cytochrome P450 n=1 Tax=Byssothecium circinans TaxID=147558 RepID=A0A6A5TKZ6_9PLEO|nr:cytochrome P450 [Byssothecium circinans]